LEEGVYEEPRPATLAGRNFLPVHWAVRAHASWPTAALSLLLASGQPATASGRRATATAVPVTRHLRSRAAGNACRPPPFGGPFRGHRTLRGPAVAGQAADHCILVQSASRKH